MCSLPASSPSWYRVPHAIQKLLLAAVATWEDTARSEQYIFQALAHPETTLDVLVSAYRYFFYKHNDRMARCLALQVMERLREREQWPEAWDQLAPILQARWTEPAIRLYLSAYTALGIMLARWGARRAAMEISTRIQAIDERNEFGAGLILNVLAPAASEFEE